MPPTGVSLAPIPFSAPWFDEEEAARVRSALSGPLAGNGPFGLKVEERLQRLLGVRRVLLTTNCTHAMELALLALGIGPGQSVICPSFTFVSTANAILRVGARVVFADIEERTLGLDPGDVERRIEGDTTALLPVHYGGLAAEMEALLDLARARRLKVVEDAAHALGASYPGGKRVGSSGNLVNFSFYANKNLTTGEGGMVVCNDRELADTMRVWRLHGLEVNAWNRYASKAYHRSMASVPGFKYNSTNINAALGLAQLEKFPRFQERREEIAAMYDSLLSDVENVEIVPRLNAGGERHALHLYVVKLNLDALSAGRDEIVVALRQENIGVGVHYDAVHLHPFYANKYGWQPEDFPIAYDISQRVISLPGQPAMSDADVLSVVEGLRKVLAHYRR